MNPTFLKIIHINIQSLCNKINEVQLFLNDVQPDVVCFTEHWLLDDYKVHFPGFNVTGYFCRRFTTHGGVIIYTRSEFDAIEIKKITNSAEEIHIECTAIKCTVDNFSFCILTLYRSPKGNVDKFFNKLDVILNEALKTCDYVVLNGDLNIDAMDDTNKQYTNGLLRDVFDSFGIISLIEGPTRVCRTRASAIDYVVTNIERKYCTVKVFDPSLSDHFAQSLTITTPNASKIVPDSGVTLIGTRRMSEKNLAHFSLLLGEINWNVCFMFCSIDQQFDCFMENLIFCFEKSCPKVVSKVKSGRGILNKSRTWVTQEISNMKKIVDCWCSLKNTFRTESIHKQYVIVRKEYRRCLRQAKYNYYGSRIQNSTSKTKEIWNIVNSELGRGKKQSEIILSSDNNTIKDPRRVANQFGKHFSTLAVTKLKSHFTVMSSACTHSINTPVHSMQILQFTESEVENAVHEIKNKYSCGFDEINVIVFTVAINIILQPFTKLINNSFMNGLFPNILKIARVIPLLKKANDPKSDISNYRPISVLPVISKIMEILMAKRILEFLYRNRLLSDAQHGYLKGRSTESACFGFIEFVTRTLDDNKLAAGMFFDLSCAFDSVNKEFLANKLEKLGVRGVVNDWIISYLNNRKMLVKVADGVSDRFDVGLGVPQGSVLGPLLYVLFVNDLELHMNVECLVTYADDTTIGISANSQEELIMKVELSAKMFKEWCTKNNLMLNCDKTAFIVFHKRKEVLPCHVHVDNCIIVNQETTKLLGLTIDQNLTWNAHLDGVCKKLNSTFFAIKNLKDSLPLDGILRVYYALAYPSLSFNVILWGRSTCSKRVFMNQKRIIRLMFNLKNVESCRSFFIRYNLLTLYSIFIYKCCMYVFNNKDVFVRNCQMHMYETRNGLDILLSQHNLALYEKGPMYSCGKVYNRLPNFIKHCDTVFSFKNKLKTFLVEKCYYSLDEFLA